MRHTKKYTEAVKRQAIEEAKSTGNLFAVARKRAIPLTTLHGWLKPKDNQEATTELKLLKKKLADAELKTKILEELLKKTYQVWPTG